jgi:hypothetical protein
MALLKCEMRFVLEAVGGCKVKNTVQLRQGSHQVSFDVSSGHGSKEFELAQDTLDVKFLQPYSKAFASFPKRSDENSTPHCTHKRNFCGYSNVVLLLHYCVPQWAPNYCSRSS